MSDILDDLKMMADHCDQENGDEPCDLGMLLIRAIAEIRKLRQQPVSAAEVPMPDIAGELFDGKRVCDEADVRTYGDAREAAGYAAGVAAGGKDAERLDFLDRNLKMQMGWQVGIAPAGNASVTSVIQLGSAATSIRAAIDAALRGEVKP